MENLNSFSEIRELLEEGKITCEALVNHYLENIQQNNHLNAFVEVYEEEARSQAKALDQKIREGNAGSLAGLVVAVKDVISHQGHDLNCGSDILKGFEAQFNATPVQRLLDEDAIIIGRTNCDEFGMGSSNENSAFGPVKNPVDNQRVPGGSSGGSAVAVQAGMCQVALGTDTGGSVRQPAAFCGIVGLKPTYSRISRYGLAAYASSFDTIGIFSRSIEDNALLLEILSGPDEFDSTVSHQPVPKYRKKDSEQKFRVGYIKETLESEGLDPVIREKVQQSIEHLRENGHSVDEVEFPLLDYILPTYYILTTAEASSNLSRYDGVKYGFRSDNSVDLESMYKKTRSEGFQTETKRRIMLGTFVLSASYYDAFYTKAQKVRKLIREQTTALLSNHDCLILPTTPTPAFMLGEHLNDPLEMYLADLFTVQASVSGVPAISIPAGNNPEGLPIGIQLIGNSFEEEKLYAISEILLHRGS